MSGAADPRSAARALRGLIESEADACDRALGLTAPLVDAFERARLFQLMVPGELGGLDADSDTLLDVFEGRFEIKMQTQTPRFKDAMSQFLYNSRQQHDAHPYSTWRYEMASKQLLQAFGA